VSHERRERGGEEGRKGKRGHTNKLKKQETNREKR
jgi:hypothetical protein